MAVFLQTLAKTFLSQLQKKPVKMPYYAVRTGRNPGIYSTWDECREQVDRFPRARYKKFQSWTEAEDFINDSDNMFHVPRRRKFRRHRRQQYHQDYVTDEDTVSESACFEHQSNDVDSNGTEQADEEKRLLQQKLDVQEKEIKCLKMKIDLLNRKDELCKELAQLRQSNYLLEQLQQASSVGSSHSLKSATSSPYTLNRHHPYQNRTSATSSRSWRAPVASTASTSSSGAVRTATVYTDGACTNNGFKGARAGIGVYWGPNNPRNVSESLPGRPTNNRAEIHAVVRAAEQAQEMGVGVLNVKTDSQFLIKSMTQWIGGWKRNGWKLSNGNNVVNKDDFQALEKASKNLKINWEHVRGHQGIEGNECADRLAVAGAEK